MNIGWLQLAWLAAGDVNFNFMDEAFQWMEIGNISKRKNSRQMGGWEKEEGQAEVRWMAASGRRHVQLMTGENSVEDAT